MNTLREIIRKILLEEVQNPDMVERLNQLIDAANENEATWNLARWDRDNPWAEAPSNDRDQIELLMHSLDWVENPPKELKCWYIIEVPDGEIINNSNWLSYEQVLQYAKENDYHPADELGNYNPDGPSKEQGGSGLYFIYEDDLPLRESRYHRGGKKGFKIKDKMGTELICKHDPASIPPEFEHPGGVSGVIKRKEIVKMRKGIMYYNLTIAGKSFEGEFSGYGYAARGIDDFGPFSMRLKDEHPDLPPPLHEPQIVFAWAMGNLRIFDV